MGSTRPRDFTAAIEKQRKQLFKASAVAAMCRFACTSLENDLTLDELADALQVVSDLLDDVVEALEKLNVGSS